MEHTNGSQGLPCGLHQYILHTKGTTILFVLNGCFILHSGSHPPSTLMPPPTDSIYDITGIKNFQNQKKVESAMK